MWGVGACCWRPSRAGASTVRFISGARARPGVGMYSARALDIDEGCARHRQPRALEFGRGAVGVPALALPNAAGPGVLAMPAATSARTPARSAASADITTTAAVRSEIERHRPRGGKTVGTLPQRCACSGTPVDEVVRRRATPGWGGGTILASLTDTMATAANFASRRGDEVDPDQEMVGIGTSNVAADSSRGLPSPSAVAAQPWLTSLEPGPNWLA
jgi:hypothetical protein